MCYFIFWSLDLICLRVPELITTNNHFPCKTNSTWWNLKSTKSYRGKSAVIYNTYPPEGNYFRREEVKSLFWAKNNQIQLNNTPNYNCFWITYPETNYNLSPLITTFIIYSVCLYSTFFFSPSQLLLVFPVTLTR